MRKIDLENERSFENRKASGEVRSAQSKFYWAVRIPKARHNQTTFEAIKGKNILEIGCASGSDAIEYSKHAESYTGVDISDKAIDNCRSLNLANATFHCTDGHVLPIADNSVEGVIVNGLLHHMDLNLAFSEIRRVLKPNGFLVFREPLGTNPIFQLYRLLTPGARTVDERPFTFRDLKLMRSFFVMQEVQWFGFTSIVSAFVRLQPLRSALTRLDSLLSRTPLRYLYWQFAGVAIVKK